MTNVFNYVQIDEALIHDLSFCLNLGQSVVMLGYPNSGKGLVREKLRKILAQESYGPVLSVNFMIGKPIETVQEAAEQLCGSVRRAGLQPGNGGTEILSTLDSLDATPILFASNIDSMNHQVARRLLQEIRSRVTEKRLIVFASGEYGLRELVHGKNSEFNVAHQYVLQGFGKSIFSEFLQKYLHTMALKADDEVIEFFWKLTGGHGDVTVALIVALIEMRNRSNLTPVTAVTRAEIEAVLARLASLGVPDSRFVRQANRLIPLEPNCWDNLRKLINGEPVLLRDPDGPPGPLTLAGVAVRKKGRLEFSSDLMASVVRRFYDSRHLGDLYAQDHQWEAAFRCWAELSPEQKLRPSHGSDREAIRTSVDAACSALHIEAIDGPQRVEVIFAQACQHLLGFPEVAYWDKRGEQWQLRICIHCQITEEGEQASARTLGLVIDQRCGEIVVPRPWHGSAFALRLESEWADDCVVVAGDFDRKNLVSRERELLFKRVAQHFLQAHARAVSVARNKFRLDFQAAESEITSSILGALGSEVLDVDGVLKRAARRLRQLGYRRIAFALVNTKRSMISGVLDDSDLDLSDLKPWRLDQPGSNVHPFVISTRKPYRSFDPLEDQLTTHDAVKRAGIQAFAVVPILVDDNERAIGTIHVEREDHRMPAQHEIECFLSFGRVLGGLIQQGERVCLLQRTLDHIPEPLVITNVLKAPCYANKRAEEVLGIQKGWHKTPLNPRSLASLEHALDRAINLERVVWHQRGFPAARDFAGSCVVHGIQNWRNEVSGVFVHVEDLTNTFAILDALGQVFQAHDRETAPKAILEALRRLGTKWARLYLLKSVGGQQVLISHRQFGFEPGSPDAIDFEAGKTELRREGDLGEQVWQSLVQREPLVFCYGPDNRVNKNAWGLEVNVTRTNLTGKLAKRLGDYWIDVPICVGDGILGKITMQCDVNFLPERFEFLKIFFGIVHAILHANLSKEQADKNASEMQKRLLRYHALGVINHNLATQVVAIESNLTQYRHFEKELPEIQIQNDLFSEGIESAKYILFRAKRVLAMPPPTFTRVDARALVEGVLKRSMARDEWTLVPESGEISGDLDPTLVSGALSEMIDNAKDLAAPLRLSVEVATGSNVEEKLRIIVCDTGPGVPRRLKETIFNEFVTERPPNSKWGSGLGLSYVRRVVEDHGGTIAETGDFGKGARFEIELPRFRRAETS